jgi:hypothetical protein
LGVGPKADNFSQQITVAKSKAVKTGWCNKRYIWQKFLRNAYGSNRAVLPMIIIMKYINFINNNII